MNLSIVNDFTLNTSNFNYSMLTCEALPDRHVFTYNLTEKIIFLCVITPIVLLSITGNMLVILAMIKTDLKDITGNIFLGSLACADCIIGCTVMPFYAIQLLIGRWYLKSFTCRLWFSFDVLFSTASILHLFCVSLDRYLSVTNFYAYKYLREGKMRIRLMIAGVWITSALISFIPIFTDIFTTSENSLYIKCLDYAPGVCLFEVNMSYRIVSGLISFWIPGFGMVIFYSLLYRKAAKIKRSLRTPQSNLSLTNPSRQGSKVSNENEIELRELNSKSNDNNNTVRNSLIPKDEHEQELTSRKTRRYSTSSKLKEEAREYKALITLGTVIVVFVLCWFFFFLNYVICNGVTLDCPKLFGDKINSIKDDILFWIGYFNSAINPFLYNFTNRDFQKAFRQLLHLKPKRRHYY